MTLQQFLTKYLGKTKGYPDDNQFLGQCLSIVKLYIKECFGILPPPSGTNSAYGYWSNFPNPLGTVFEKVENTPDLIPQEGWIAVWKPWDNNEFGHIAIVASGSTTGTLKNYAQNWTSKVFQLESNRYTNVIGFLKPIKEDNMTDEQKRILDFIGDRSEGDVREAFGALADIKPLQNKVERLETEIGSLKLSVESAQVDIEDLRETLSEAQKTIEDYQTVLKSANSKIVNLEKQVETKEQEIVDVREVSNKYQRLYKEALANSASNQTTKELISLLIKKLWSKK